MTAEAPPTHGHVNSSATAAQAGDGHPLAGAGQAADDDFADEWKEHHQPERHIVDCRAVGGVDKATLDVEDVVDADDQTSLRHNLVYREHDTLW